MSDVVNEPKTESVDSDPKAESGNLVTEVSAASSGSISNSEAGSSSANNGTVSNSTGSNSVYDLLADHPAVSNKVEAPAEKPRTTIPPEFDISDTQAAELAKASLPTIRSVMQAKDLPTTVATQVKDEEEATLAPAKKTTRSEPLSLNAAAELFFNAPAEPEKRGNRWFGIMVTLIASIACGGLYAAASFLMFWGKLDFKLTPAIEAWQFFVQTYVFWGPIAVFFIAYVIIVIFGNNGAYWGFAVFSILIAVAVYFGSVASYAIGHGFFAPGAAKNEILSRAWFSPFVIVATVLAREIPIWFSGWIAARGRKVKALNNQAYEEYEKKLTAVTQTAE